MKTVSINGSYATGADKSGFDIAIEVQLREPEQVEACLKAGVQSTLYRGGNSVLDKAFAPKTGKDGKPNLKDFKRESIPFNTENAQKITDLLTKFFTDKGEGEGAVAFADGVTIVVGEKVPGGSGNGGMVEATKRAEAFMAGKTQDQIDTAVEKLEARNPGLAVKYTEGKVLLQDFAIAMKIDAKRIQDEAAKQAMAELEA